MGLTVQGIGKGGSRCPDDGKHICIVVPGGSIVWVRDVGDDITHWECFGHIPSQGSPQADDTATLES